MPVCSNPSEPLRYSNTAAAGQPTTPIAAEAADFRAAHGPPATWDAQEFEVYLDLERVGTSATKQTGDAPT
ncbi:MULTISPECIES: hypothetical protein [Streptomyces]|uniref:Uncharacterized protein n=2 Tax=Streptomyces TaxID=1883 RepID=A0A5P0YU51_9ACTN|nr:MULTISPECIES: hypothetical protein [Streptomyces]MBB1246746.1 hypothetical protein [Streptomyces durbertensis]MBB1261387.1 hypothetical protein [Streptomyces alkaliterrae]MQS03440.1 hypothetical protein [Streptomyces alkaliterrae]